MLRSNKSITCRFQASVKGVLKRPSVDLKTEDRRYLTSYSLLPLVSPNYGNFLSTFFNPLWHLHVSYRIKTLLSKSVAGGITADHKWNSLSKE